MGSQQFVMQTLQPFMPPDFRETEKDLVELERYEERKAQAAVVKLQKEREAGGSFPDALDLTDSSMSVIQCRSSALDWESTALMGAHPGVMFGCHTSASLDALDFESCYGHDGEFNQFSAP